MVGARALFVLFDIVIASAIGIAVIFVIGLLVALLFVFVLVLSWALLLLLLLLVVVVVVSLLLLAPLFPDIRSSCIFPANSCTSGSVGGF